jgi:sulfur carrier protein
MSETINVWINARAHQLPSTASLSDAVLASQIQPPFAAAVNLQFVPRSQYEHRQLQDGDKIELISPITGG